MGSRESFMEEVAFKLGFEGQRDSEETRLGMKTRTGLGGGGGSDSSGMFDLP